MDSADQSALDMDQGIDYSLLEMKYEQYKDIADAFRKLQNNTYGQCEECGEEIDIKRLAVNPLARYCVACKTKKEATGKHPEGRDTVQGITIGQIGPIRQIGRISHFFLTKKPQYSIVCL